MKIKIGKEKGSRGKNTKTSLDSAQGRAEIGAHGQSWESGENGLNITTTVAGRVQC